MRNPRRIAVPLETAQRVAVAILVASTALLAPVRAAFAQTKTGTVIVRIAADSSPVPGANIDAGTATGVSDRAGTATFTLPTGRRTLHVTSAGFRPESLSVDVIAGMTKVTVALRHAAELPDGLVGARREIRRGTDEPTNVEVADRNALEEQTDKSPGSISDLLNHMDGVRVQPLSAGAGGAGIRIRGMPARYTKVLFDGLPLYGATPEGMEPLQTSALDLQRVEVVPGVMSALAGPTALSGIVNIVSAPATAPSEVVVNGSSRKGSDVALFQTHTFSPQLGATLVAGRYYQNDDDLDKDGWAEVAGYKRIAVRPRVYWARSDESTWFMTGGWTSENRRSGTFENARLPDFRRYSDDADTRRADAGTVGRIVLDQGALLTVRASMTREWRTRWFGEDRERDRRNMVFGDVALTKTQGDNTIVGGVALERDQYAALDTRDQSYRYTTPAFFAEHTWSPASWFGVTSAARLDLHSDFGDFVSPRMSVVLRPSDEWTARISASSGVYAPTPFTDETLAYGLSSLRRSNNNREAEHATGWSVDLTRVEEDLEMRLSAYRTMINHPLILRTSPGSVDEVELVNADEPSHTQGIDVSMRTRGDPLRFGLTYSYLDAMRPQIAEIVGVDFSVDTTLHRAVPLNPRHAASFEVAYDREDDKIVAVEMRFVGKQTLSDTLYSSSHPYVTVDARLEKHFGPVVLFARGKNLTGIKQGQFDPVLLKASGTQGQWTRDVWAPLDGLIVNAGLRMKY